MRLFIYGTLLDAELRARLLGPAARRLVLTRAAAPGRRAMLAAGRDFPVLVPARGAAAQGVLAEGLGPRALARLKAYEGAEYRLAPVTVMVAGHGAGQRRRVTALAFLPRRGVRWGFRAFALGRWQARAKAQALRAGPRAF